MWYVPLCCVGRQGGGFAAIAEIRPRAAEASLFGHSYSIYTAFIDLLA
jgi:hypothetical protein